MKTIFENLKTNQKYGGLSEHPKIVLQLNSMLSKLGIKKSENIYTNIDLPAYFLENITMLIRAFPDGGEMYFTDLRNKLGDKGFNSVDDMYHQPGEACEDIKIKVKIGVPEKEFTVGHYLRNRNLIIMNISLFNFDWVGGDYKYYCILMKNICDAIKALKIKKVNIKDSIRDYHISKFSNQAKENLVTLKRGINTFHDSIGQWNEAIVNAFKDIEVSQEKIKTLNKFISKGNSLVCKSLKEISSLPFVESVELTTKGIRVYIGCVETKDGKKIHNLGRFIIYINYSNIRIFNLDAIKKGGHYYDHPHVKDSKPCLGEWNEKVNSLLVKLDFKQLVLLLKIYLQTCRGGPHLNLLDFLGFREKQPLRLKDKIPETDKERTYLDVIRKEDVKKAGLEENEDD